MRKPRSGKQKSNRGPKPETLQITGTMEDSIRKALSRGKFTSEKVAGKDKRAKPNSTDGA